jgi:hypothetical protein
VVLVHCSCRRLFGLEIPFAESQEQIQQSFKRSIPFVSDRNSPPDGRLVRASDLLPLEYVLIFHSETVVARGAVLRYLNPSFLGDRFLRTSYGIKQTQTYRAGKHDSRFKVQDEHENRIVVHDCVFWVYRAVFANRSLDPINTC